MTFAVLAGTGSRDFNTPDLASCGAWVPLVFRFSSRSVAADQLGVFGRFVAELVVDANDDGVGRFDRLEGLADWLLDLWLKEVDANPSFASVSIVSWISSAIGFSQVAGDGVDPSRSGV